MSDIRGYWHDDDTPGHKCNHLARLIGGECGRPDSGTWTPLVPAALNGTADLHRTPGIDWLLDALRRRLAAGEVTLDQVARALVASTETETA